MELLGRCCRLHMLLSITMMWISCVEGLLRCDCNTQECKDAGMTTCIARKSCYAELYQNELNRGCDPTPLACENRRPSGLQQLEWPSLYCCRHKNLCNKNATPTVSTSDGDKEDHPVNKDTVPYTPAEGSPDFLDQGVEKAPGEEPSFGESNCSDPDPEQRARTRSQIVNPIYIAVPVAGVCVLLALIIFAMYLLRRRTDYHHPHDSSFNSHHHIHHEHNGGVAGVPGHKKNGALGQQQQTMSPEQHPNVVPHHCHCVCKKQPIVPMPPCGKSANRCTDSERSSSGSETRLFLQS